MSKVNNPLGALAKDCLDVGLFTNQLEPQLAFWQTTVGLPFDHMLPVGGGVRQHRHDHAGSVFKLNHSRVALEESNGDQPDSGYLRLRLALPGITNPGDLVDPDGNRVQLVPPGFAGIEQWAIEVACGSAPEFYAFYESGLGLPRVVREVSGGEFECAVRCGRSLIVGCIEPALAAVPLAESQARSSQMRQIGFNYTTIQVQKVDEVHASVLANGGLEGSPPTTLGETARISFVRDQRGNWMELSQRASLTGPL